MPDLMEAVGKDVLDEPTQELNRVQGCGLVAFGAEGDMPRANSQDPRVGDAHAVGVATQILKYVLGAAEGGLGIDDPVASDT